jgi:hypothetical protein
MSQRSGPGFATAQTNSALSLAQRTGDARIESSTLEGLGVLAEGFQLGRGEAGTGGRGGRQCRCMGRDSVAPGSRLDNAPAEIVDCWQCSRPHWCSDVASRAGGIDSDDVLERCCWRCGLVRETLPCAVDGHVVARRRNGAGGGLRRRCAGGVRVRVGDVQLLDGSGDSRRGHSPKLIEDVRPLGGLTVFSLTRHADFIELILGVGRRGFELRAQLPRVSLRISSIEFGRP